MSKYQLPGTLLKKAKITSRWGTVYYIFASANLGGLIGCIINGMIGSGLVITMISLVSFTAGFIFSSEGKHLKELAEKLEKYTSLLEEKDDLCNKILELVKTENEKEENKKRKGGKQKWNSMKLH